MQETALGIDIGGTGIKGAIVALPEGKLLSERYRVDTPSPATPKAVAEAVRELVSHFEYQGPIGVAYPGIIRDNVARLAANLDPTFLGVDLGELFGRAAGTTVTLLNDADAAGLAEMRCGSGVGTEGTVLLLTFGTGIGSALFRQGVLVPNTELGHLELDGTEAELRASGSARKRESLTWDEWCRRVNRYLAHVEMLFSPDLILVGGGVSKRWEKFGFLLEASVPIVPAVLRNNAGIVGAAFAAAEA